jgi:ABC-type transport system involved in multi-copper enzyme maturation permease subunit
MFDEPKRGYRKIMRFGRPARIVILVLFVVIYLWSILMTITSGSDVSIFFSYLELILVTLIIPSSIHGAISAERERATWDALMLTRLTAGQIIIGKLIWRFRLILALLALLLVPALLSRTNPDTFDISNGMLWHAQLMILAWCLLLCSFGLWVSSSTKRSITSLAVIIGSLIGVLIAVPILYDMFCHISGGGGPGQGDLISSAMTTFNPFLSLYPMMVPPDSESGLIAGGLSGWPQIGLYTALSVLFLVFTYWRIIGLEKPVRGRR